MKAGFPRVGVWEFVEEGGDALSGETPVIGGELVYRKEEMCSQQEYPVVRQAAIELCQRRPRVFYVFDCVEQECRPYRSVSEAQSVEVVKLVDADPRVHVDPGECATREDGPNRGEVGLAGSSGSAELDDWLRQALGVGQTL